MMFCLAFNPFHISCCVVCCAVGCWHLKFTPCAPAERQLPLLITSVRHRGEDTDESINLELENAFKLKKA